MAIINGNEYIKGVGGGTYVKDLFDTTSPTITTGEHTTTGIKVNVTGKGLLSLVDYANQQLPSLTLTIDGVVFSGNIETLSDLLGARESYGAGSTYTVKLPFEESAVVNITGISSTLKITVAL